MPKILTPNEVRKIRERAEKKNTYRYNRSIPADDALTLCTSHEALREDQNDWRKGVELIASSLGEKDPPDLCCVRIGQVALEVMATNERLEADNAKLRSSLRHYQNLYEPKGRSWEYDKCVKADTANIAAKGGEDEQFNTKSIR